MRLRLIALVPLVFASCSSGTFALVTFAAANGAAPPGLKSVDVQLMLGGKQAAHTFKESSGRDIALPTTASFQLHGGGGSLQVQAIGRDAAGGELGRGTTMIDVPSSKTTSFTVSIAFAVTPVDGGVDGALDGAVDLSGGGVVVLAVDHQPALDFGTVVAGTDSGTNTLTVSNSGTASSGALGAAMLTGDPAFKITNDGCVGKTLAPQAWCTVAVKLSPTVAGSPAATFSISAAPGGTATTALKGNAVKPGSISVTPSPALFGNAVASAGSKDLTLTATNSGGVATGAITVSITGSDAGQFSVALGGTCSGATLQPNGTCTVNVHFAPTSTGMKAASLVLDSTPGGPGVASLQGTGINDAKLAFDMPSYGFSTVAVGMSPTQTLTLSNQGMIDSGPLPTLATTGDASFSVVAGGTCTAGTAVPAGQSCTIKVQMKPSTYGSKSGAISVTASPGGTASATLGGTGSQVFALTVTKSGTGTGSITSTPTGDINCDLSNTKCSNMYTVTTTAPMVTLTATQSATSTFGGWSGACTNGTGNCTVTVDASKSVNATFTIKQVTVTVDTITRRSNSFGAAGGNVTITGFTGACSTPPCSVTINAGTSVTLTANPAAKIGLEAWLEGCAGTAGPICTLSPTSNVTVGVTFTPFNYAFVTSGTFLPNWGALSNADALCNTAASNGSSVDKTGHYTAWLSTAGPTPPAINAKDRLKTSGGSDARGWLRSDGLLFADQVSNLTNATIYAPPVMDENAALVVSAVTATGTNFSGGAGNINNTCTDYTGAGTLLIGVTGSTSQWSAALSNQNCGSQYHLYCFQTDFVVPIAPRPIPAGGRRAFLSFTSFTPGATIGGQPAGLASADALCHADATSASLPNPTHFKALLATSTATALSRFNTGLGAWFRLDGAPLAPTAATLGTLANTYTTLNVFGSGFFSLGNGSVWTGATFIGSNATVSTCGDWTSTSGNGIVALDGEWQNNTCNWFDCFPTACTTAASIYCLEDQ